MLENQNVEQLGKRRRVSQKLEQSQDQATEHRESQGKTNWVSLDGNGDDRVPSITKTAVQKRYLEVTSNSRHLSRSAAKKLRNYLQVAIVPSRYKGGPRVNSPVDLSKPVLSNSDIEFVIVKDYINDKRFDHRDTPRPVIGFTSSQARLSPGGVSLNMTDGKNPSASTRRTIRFDLLRYPKRRQSLMQEHTVGEEVRYLQVERLPKAKDLRVVLYLEKGPIPDGSLDWVHVSLDWEAIASPECSTLYRIPLKQFERGLCKVVGSDELPTIDKAVDLGEASIGLRVLEMKAGSSYYEPVLQANRNKPVFRTLFDATQADNGFGLLGVELLKRVDDFLGSTAMLESLAESWMHKPMVGMLLSQLDSFIDSKLHTPSVHLRSMILNDLKAGSAFIEAVTTSTVVEIVKTGENPHIKYADGTLQAINSSALLVVKTNNVADLVPGTKVEEGQFIGYYLTPGVSYRWDDVVDRLGYCLHAIMSTQIESVSIQPGIGWDGDMWLVPANLVAGLTEGQSQGLFWVDLHALAGGPSQFYNRELNSIIYPTIRNVVTANQTMVGDMRVVL